MLDPAVVRPLFPGAEGCAYLDAASLGLAPASAAQAVGEMADLVCRPRTADAGARHVELGRLRAPVRSSLARLIGAEDASIALVENASHGLGLAAAAIPMAAGENVVLSGIDFIQTAVPWVLRQERDGIEVRFVPPRDGRVEVDDLVAHMDRRTRVVCVSSVQWTCGHRIDLDRLSAVTRDRSVWLVVDGAQHVGSVRLNVSETPVDFLAVSGHKWLNSPFGLGFLHVGPRAAGELEPPHPGYLAARPPRGNWGAYFADPGSGPDDALTFPDDARPWETGGTPNSPGAVGLGAAVGTIHRLGADAVEQHVLELGGRLRERLLESGHEVVTPEQRAGIVTFRVRGGSEEQRTAWAHLRARGVHLSLRYASGVGGLRASVHLFNDEEDVERLVEALGGLR